MSATIGTLRRADDLLQRRGRVRRRAGDADDVGAGLLAAADLVDRRLRVGGRRVGHGLDGDRRVAADRDGADHDLPRLAPLDIAPGTDGRHEYLCAAYRRSDRPGKGVRALSKGNRDSYRIVLTGLTGLAGGGAMAKLAQLPATLATRRRPAKVLARPRAAATRYYAFLSYSHKDKELADWLHRELEKFRVPRRARRQAHRERRRPRRLTPIFRDQHELCRRRRPWRRRSRPRSPPRNS